jgi:endoglycosylceramidase
VIGRWRGAALAAAGVAAFLYLTPAAGAPAGSAGQAPPYRLGYLHAGPVSGPAGLPQVLDERNRVVTLRGVNVNGLVDYYQDSATPLAVPYPISPAAYAGGACPPRNPAVESMTVCALDLPQMAGLGYNSVRLAVSWSLLEPSPGQIDSTYIERIAQVVEWSRAAGLYVIVDLHQDAWSKYVYTRAGESCPPAFKRVEGWHEADGAPAWASAHNTPACALMGTRELDVAVQENFQRLWSNLPGPDGVGLQDHYAAVVVALAQRFHHEPAVAGYELMNEPSPGFMPPDAMAPVALFPFYGKVVNQVVAKVPGFRQLFFVEPDITRDVTDQSAALVPWSAYSAYPHVVYSPHVYTRVFTPDQQLNAAAGTPRFFPMDGGYRSAVVDAKALGLPLWVGEFGNGVPDDETMLRAHYVYADQYTIGNSLWVWKADEAAQFSVYRGPFGAGTPFASRVKFTSRAYPFFTAGTLRGLDYNPDTGAFDLRATSAAVRCGDRARATVMFLPAASGGPALVQGASADVLPAPGGRLALVYPAGGDYRLSLGPGATGVAARGC